ncbi:hypothetical protein VNI00_011330 [Paramarasmius palmivorus]|uniref:Uncharacterized protein n=1 Tax=Paramarasmius palmivorus TaxID=297713 RepID=A0AAW0CE86_9AGAR
MSPSKKNPQPPHTPEAPLEFSLDSASKQHLEVGPGVSVHAPLMPSVQYARQSPPRQFLVQSEEPQPLPSKRKSIPTAKAQYLIQNNDNEESQIARNIFESNKGLELECISVGEPEDQDSSGNPNIFESARKEHEGALSNDKGNEGASSTEASDPSKWETPLGNFRKKDEKKPFRPTALHGFNPDALRDAVNKSSSAYQTPPPTVKKRARSPQDEVESPSPVKKRLDNQDLGSPVPKANESSSIPATFVLTWPDGRQVKVQEVLEKSPADLPSSVGGNNSQRGTNDPIHTSNSNVRKTESSAPTAPASKQAFGTDDSIHTSNSNVRKTESSAPTAPTSKQTFDIPPAIPSSPEPEYVPAEPWTFERDPEKEAEVERSFMELTVPPLVRFTASIQKFDSQTQRKMMNRYHAKAKYKDFPENIRQIFKPRWQDRLMRDFYLKSAAQPHSALLRPSMLVPYTIATSAEKKTRIFASFHRVVEPMSPVAATYQYLAMFAASLMYRQLLSTCLGVLAADHRSHLSR